MGWQAEGRLRRPGKTARCISPNTAPKCSREARLSGARDSASPEPMTTCVQNRRQRFRSSGEHVVMGSGLACGAPERRRLRPHARRRIRPRRAPALSAAWAASFGRAWAASRRRQRRAARSRRSGLRLPVSGGRASPAWSAGSMPGMRTASTSSHSTPISTKTERICKFAETGRPRVKRCAEKNVRDSHGRVAAPVLGPSLAIQLSIRTFRAKMPFSYTNY